MNIEIDTGGWIEINDFREPENNPFPLYWTLVKSRFSSGSVELALLSKGEFTSIFTGDVIDVLCVCKVSAQQAALSLDYTDAPPQVS